VSATGFGDVVSLAILMWLSGYTSAIKTLLGKSQIIFMKLKFDKLKKDTLCLNRMHLERGGAGNGFPMTQMVSNNLHYRVHRRMAGELGDS
jgi:hypothetical protein